MSYRGHTLIINNLMSSSLWHRLACVDPPRPNLLSRIQTVLVNFFWDKLHWILQAVLFLPKEEGGQGLIHLPSRGATFRLLFIQRMLFGPKDLVWRPLAHIVVQRFGGLGLPNSLFLVDVHTLKLQTLPSFYCGVFTVWKTLVKERLEHRDSFYWLLREPVVHGGRLDTPCWVGLALTELFYRTRILTLGSVVDIAGFDLNNTAALAASLGIRSVRIIKQLLEHWKHCLTGHECVLLENYCHSVTVPNADDPFPPVGVHPRFGNCTGFFFGGEQLYSAKPTRGKR